MKSAVSAVAPITLALLIGCQSYPVNPTEMAVQIPAVLTTNPAELVARVRNPNSSIILERSGSVAVQAFADDYKLVGVSSAMNVGATAVRATHVAVLGNAAFVSYALEGDAFSGGLEMVDITDPNAPQVTSSLAFDMLDVNAVYADANANEVYFTGAVDVDKLADILPNVVLPAVVRPAFIGKAPLVNGKLGSPVSIRLLQHGFTGNSLVKTNAGLFVSSGDQQAVLTDSTAGGIGLLNSVNLGTQSWSAFARAQFLAVQGDTIAALEAGSAGQVRLYNSNNLNAPTGSIALGNVGSVEAKNTLHLDNKYIYVAKGTAGLEVYNPSSNSAIFKFANQIPVGVPNAFEYTTNAVTTDGDLVYISGGAAGVYVARVPSTANASKSLNFAGRFDLKDANGVRGSANFVATDTAKRLLFVASGDGGLKIIRRNIPNTKTVGTGIMARGNITINGQKNLLNGTTVSANDSSTPVPQVSAIVAKAVPTNCTKIVSGTQNVNTQSALDSLFGTSACLEVRGDLNLNFNAILTGKTLVVGSKNNLNANAGMRLTDSVVVAGRPTINSSLNLSSSSLIASNSSHTLNLNVATIISGASTFASMGHLNLNGNLATTDEYPNFLAVAQNTLTINGSANFKGILWSGGAMTINGALNITGSMMSGTTILINGGVTATYEARNDNPHLL